MTDFAASLRAALPEFLRSRVSTGLELWQLLAALGLAMAVWLMSVLVVAFLALLLRRLSARTTTTIDDEVAARLVGPARLFAFVLLARPSIGLLGLPPAAQGALGPIGKAVLLLALFWGLLRMVTLAVGRLGASEWAQARPGSKSLVMLGGSIARVSIFAVGVVTVLSELQYPVASILAGLGLGGLAIALAAQKTVENLLGAFALAVDQPIRVGDVVRVEDFIGTVEQIGMRSTRFRTADRTIISIPNGKLAEARLETFAVRDRIRLACTLGLVYGTTALQMRQVLAEVEAALRRHPKLWPDVVVVKLKELAASSLDVEVMAWFETSDWAEFQQIRQDLLLEFIEAIDKAGTSFAFPSRTVHLVTKEKDLQQSGRSIEPGLPTPATAPQ